MKKNLLLIAVCLTYLAGYVFNGCKKEKPSDVPESNPGISTSFTEEFDTVYEAMQKRDWQTKSPVNAMSVLWSQGTDVAYDKWGVPYGFPAYSFTKKTDEYAGIFVFDNNNSSSTISSWLITPVLYVKNGDRISFYTRADNGAAYIDRLQVRLNSKASTNIGTAIDATGDFGTTLFDINSKQSANAYPAVWTKYEYTFSGLSKKTNVRIGFRYFVPANGAVRGIGIDQFKFEVQ